MHAVSDDELLLSMSSNQSKRVAVRRGSGGVVVCGGRRGAAVFSQAVGQTWMARVMAQRVSEEQLFSTSGRTLLRGGALASSLSKDSNKSCGAAAV